MFCKWMLPAVLLMSISVFMLVTGCSSNKQPANNVNGEISSEQQKQLHALNQAADELYRHTNDQNLPEAIHNLDQLSDLITALQFKGITSVEGMEVLTETVVQAKRTIRSVHYSPREGLIAAARIRLAADALTHPKQPMWLQYYSLLTKDTNELSQAIKAQDQARTTSALQQFRAHYEIIRPAAFLSRAPELMEKTDSLFTFLYKQTTASQINYQVLEQAMIYVPAVLDELFGRTSRTAYLPLIEPDQPITWTLFIAAVIMAVLTFAGWRMIRFERNHIHVYHNQKEG